MTKQQILERTLLQEYLFWTEAYDALKEEKSDQVTRYEQLLSRMLIRGTPLTRIKPFAPY